MTLAQLPPAAVALIQHLINIRPGPESIWLIGSRANGTHTALSDTDLIVFATPAYLVTLKETLNPTPAVDVLIVYDGNSFQDPWQDKRGSLNSFEWKTIDATHAKYVGTKWVADDASSIEFNADMGDLVQSEQKAFRVWPEAA